MSSGLWFVTPAFGRFEMTEVCLTQRVQVIAALGEVGIEAHCVVIADDANLDTARMLGLETVRRNNQWLGRRFNDGIEYAGLRGAEWVAPIGSDSFVDPAYFLSGLPGPGAALTSHEYAPVEARRLAELRVGSHGAGPHVFHRSLLEPSGFRPATDEIGRNTDHSTISGLGITPAWEWRDLHPLQYVGFRCPPFITEYRRLFANWGIVQRDDPWPRLAAVYGDDLTDRAHAAMVAALGAAAA